MTTDKTPATLAVDVLAVLDELIDFEERHAEYEPRQNHEAREARAAVADLIEKLEPPFRESGVIWDEEPVVLRGSTVNAIWAALARVKGESA